MQSPETLQNRPVKKTKQKYSQPIDNRDISLQLKSIKLNQIKKACLSLAFASVSILGTIAPARALQFNFTYAPNTTVEQMVGFEMAGLMWSRYLKDDVTVNIHVEMVGDLPTDVIGGALPGISANQKYQTWRQKLQRDRTSTDDFTAFNNLQDEQDKFTAYVDGFKIDNNEYLNMTSANAKALGMLSGNANQLDGYIVMNTLADSSKSWNYNYTNDTVPTNSFDFLSVGVHEIGHVLGFVSGIDDPGWLHQRSQYNEDNVDDYYATLIGNLDHVTPLDLFRHSTASIQSGGLEEHWIDMSIGGNPFFSVDGGNTALGYYSTVANTSLGGDGEQASHWQSENNPLGIMDPLLSGGTRRNISTLDLKAMDVIGWDIQSNSIDLTSIHGQAKDRLANRLGQTTSWLDSNTTTAASLLTNNRETEVNQMIDNSEIYNMGSSGNNACVPRPGKHCPRAWQRAMWQGGLFQKGGNASTPETSTVGALIAFGLLGMGLYRKSR